MLGDGCSARVTENGKHKCMIYDHRFDKPAILNEEKFWANGCPKYPTAEDFRLGRVPYECSYIYTETGTADNEEKLNVWG